MSKKTYGTTKKGELITERMIEGFVEEAERGYAPGSLRDMPRGRGRPPLGDAAKTVESVRLDPDLRDEAARRAADEGVTVSEVVRRAVREYLKSA